MSSPLRLGLHGVQSGNTPIVVKEGLQQVSIGDFHNEPKVKSVRTAAGKCLPEQPRTPLTDLSGSVPSAGRDACFALCRGCLPRTVEVKSATGLHHRPRQPTFSLAHIRILSIVSRVFLLFSSLAGHAGVLFATLVDMFARFVGRENACRCSVDGDGSRDNMLEQLRQVSPPGGGTKLASQVQSRASFRRGWRSDTIHTVQ
ncbi:hypothetical protein B0T21DRAFT_129078 [Apiosordaria backusii]|uniref:Uncharacterized protein n=1 Tax=Apiosordaria backusii TaxID=314023 RepID=A0AA40EN50_9PEZI|nr:hypothetical protein B0T21DRAFT_129078 [Apiosordaria backusii]